jgi:phage shock protein A
MNAREISSSAPGELAAALARIASLEEELNDRDRQLEAVITDHDKDIVDLRKSFEMEGSFKKPPLHPNSGNLMSTSGDQHRWSLDSVRLSHDENNASQCRECDRLKKQLKQYQKQWREMSKHFSQVPALLEGMIRRTDNLVNNIAKIK